MHFPSSVNELKAPTSHAHDKHPIIRERLDIEHVLAVGGLGMPKLSGCTP